MSAIFHKLHSNITVIERGWLNCNQIVLTSPAENVLIDSGYGRHAANTLQFVDQALQGRALDCHLHRLINTHCHSDHMGGNRALRERYGCRITLPEGEVKHVVPWTAQSCWAAQMDQYAEEFQFDDTLATGDMFVAGGLQWRAVAAPGHDMDAFMYWCESERILITGDALWERGMGFVWPPENDGRNPFIDAAFETLLVIERLQPAMLIPGHGAPFTDVAAALAMSRARLSALANDATKAARAAIKSLFVFALLDRGAMPVAAMPGYLAKVPVYGEMSEIYLRLGFEEMAQMMLKDLTANGAVRISDGVMMPTMRA